MQVTLESIVTENARIIFGWLIQAVLKGNRAASGAFR